MNAGESTCSGSEGLADARAEVVERLRARQGEIEQAIFDRVSEGAPDFGTPAYEYVQGLRVAVAAAVEFGLSGLGPGKRDAPAIPEQAVAQAHRAARSGVSLEAVLRRYILGHALLWEYVMEEADRAEVAGQSSGLRELSQAQTSLLDLLVIGVTREHVAELKRAGRSHEHRLLERVRLLLSDANAGALEEMPALFDLNLDYDFDAEHLGVIARGTDAQEALHELAERLDRRLLFVAPGAETIWAWFGGRSTVDCADLQAALLTEAGHAEQARGDANGLRGNLSLAVGEPARGLEGWRMTHQQAQVALLVAQRQPRLLTRYADVALLAAALRDELLATSLLAVYLSPLDDARGGGIALRQTLHAYFVAEHNVSATASALNLDRSTVHNRLRESERRLGFLLHERQAELEVALRLENLRKSPAPEHPPATSLE